MMRNLDVLREEHTNRITVFVIHNTEACKMAEDVSNFISLNMQQHALFQISLKSVCGVQ